MLEPIAFVAIACLSFTGAASIAEEGKTHIESFDYTGKDLLISSWPFWRGELAYAVCEGNQDDKECKLYVRSIDRGEETVQSCDLNLKYNDTFRTSHGPFNAGNSRVVFAIRVSDTKVKLLNVHLKGCRVTETIVDLPELPARENQFFWHLSDFSVVPRESSYDLFFPNEVLCPGFFCKAVYDYDGQLIKAASSFPVNFSRWSTYQIDATSNDTYLVAELVSFEKTNVHLVRDEVDKNSTYELFNDAFDVLFVGHSTEGSKIGYCAQLEKSTVCKQYDGEGKTKIIQTEIPYVRERAFPFIDMYNLEEGFLLLTVEADPPLELNKNSRIAISVSRFDGQGKQVKSVNADPQCGDRKLFVGKLYKNSNGQICVNAICIDPLNKSDLNKFFWTTKCFVQNELF